MREFSYSENIKGGGKEKWLGMQWLNDPQVKSEISVLIIDCKNAENIVTYNLILECWQSSGWNHNMNSVLHQHMY